MKKNFSQFISHINGNRSGFTLIELLITFIIISVLASMALISYNTTRAKSRDAGRQSDVKGMRSAVELFISDHTSSDIDSIPRNTSWNDFLDDIRPYFRGGMAYYNPDYPYVYCNDSDDPKLYIVGSLLEVSTENSNTVQGPQLGYSCSECVFSSGSCTEPPDCNDVPRGKIINPGTAFCLGYDNPTD